MNSARWLGDAPRGRYSLPDNLQRRGSVDDDAGANVLDGAALAKLPQRVGRVRPHSQAVASAFAVLDKMEWLQHVGAPVNTGTVVVVRSWDEALTIFGKDRRYNANGVLEVPCERVDAVFERFPEREPWWQKAREDVKPYTALYSWIPDSLPPERQDLVFENLYEFVSMLLAEIIASPDAECTYFREQLSWFHAGHLPCGWDGDWPTGRMRVF